MKIVHHMVESVLEKNKAGSGARIVGSLLSGEGGRRPW